MNDRLHLESFLEMMAVERGSSKNTLESYRRDLDDFFEEIKSSAENIGEDEINKYMESLADRGFSASTRARKLSSLKQFFLYLYVEKIRADNHCKSVDAPKLKKALPKFLSEREVETLLETCSSDLRLKAMLEVLYASGLRVSELVNLKKSSLRMEGEDYFLLVKGKGSKERIVPLGKLAMKALEKYLPTINPENNTDNWLFPSGKSHITRQRFGQLLKEVAIKSNIDPEKVSPHVLRHSFASHMLAHGADLRLVQELLGHEQIATTQIYTHVQSTKLHELVTKHHPLAKKG